MADCFLIEFIWEWFIPLKRQGKPPLAVKCLANTARLELKSIFLVSLGRFYEELGTYEARVHGSLLAKRPGSSCTRRALQLRVNVVESQRVFIQTIICELAISAIMKWSAHVWVDRPLEAFLCKGSEIWIVSKCFCIALPEKNCNSDETEWFFFKGQSNLCKEFISMKAMKNIWETECESLK